MPATVTPSAKTQFELPLSETIIAESEDAVVATLQEAFASRVPVYPIGGGTSLDFGLTSKVSGVGLRLSSLNQVIDYPARDMTITVQAGVNMKSLSAILKKENQELPIDVPAGADATLGGVIATNCNGPRRASLGAIRDFVIGIRGVDGRGVPFKAGGRVVKNVAGYDLCKLLTGSLGLLAVITEVTLKLRPLPRETRTLVGAIDREAQAKRLSDWLGKTNATPAATVFATGPKWKSISEAIGLKRGDERWLLMARFEGTKPEIDWLDRQARTEWNEIGIQGVVLKEADSLWNSVVEFPNDPCPGLNLKATILPSHVSRFIGEFNRIDPESNMVAHVSSGAIHVHQSRLPPEGLTRGLVGRMQPFAAHCGGHLITYRAPAGTEATQQSVWGNLDSAYRVMGQVKKAFDPNDILNRGRFLFG